MKVMNAPESKVHANGFVETPTDLDRKGAAAICDELRKLLADVFALYTKTKNFHWHMSGPHFRDYHLLLDEHADQIFAMTDDIAEPPARSADGRFIPSATYRTISVWATTTRSMCFRKTCSPSCRTTISS